MDRDSFFTGRDHGLAHSSRMATAFCKKVPPTSVSPTFKLTLPSDEAAANLGQFLNTEFDLRESKTELTWRVSISKRRNKDKYEYLLMGWRPVCEQLDVRCGDFLQFTVFNNHLEFTLSRTQQQGPNEVLMNSTSHGFQDKSTSSSDEMLVAGMTIARPTVQSTEAEGPDISQQTPANMAADASPTLMRDHLLDLVMDLDVDSIDEEGLSMPASHEMETLPLMEEPAAREASNQWMGSSSDLSFMDWPEKRENPIRALSKKRKLEPETPARPWHKTYTRNGKIPRSVSFHSDLGVQESHSSDRPSVGFDPDPYRSGTRFNHFRASDAETDRLRCALREEQERAARAEMRNAKLIRVMSGAEGVLERQTSRGLSRVGAIFTAANRLISKDMAQHMGLSAAHKLGSCQLELKQLANEVLDALWQLRGLTKQKDVPSGYVAPHTLPSHRHIWRQSPCYGLAPNHAGTT